MALDPQTDQAIQRFPVASWLSKHTRVYNADGSTIYADCPVCRGKKKLGIYQESRNAVCGRCKDGGHGGDTWSGIASLPRFVKMLENCSWRDAFRMIHKLANVAESEWKPQASVKPWIPEDGVPLSDCADDEQAVVMLHNRGVQHLRSSAYLCVGGKYHERVIFPCSFFKEPTGFEAKAVSKSADLKSLYMPGMQTDDTVYTIRSWETPGAEWAALTESVLDAEVFHGWGHAVGCYGTLKPGQVNALLGLDVKKLYWFFDGDAWDKVEKGVYLTMSLWETYVVPMPADEDPSSLGPNGCRALMEHAEFVNGKLDLMDLAVKWGKR